MEKPKNVVGVFLERSGAYLLRAMATRSEEQSRGNRWQLEPAAHESVFWDKRDPAEVKGALGVLSEILNEYARTDQADSIAVCSYGPFVSLNPGDPQYGAIREDTAHKPLNGESLASLFYDLLPEKWRREDRTRFGIFTDANACALGEAYIRDTSPDTILAFFCITDGVGLGLVRGREFIPSALHPEVGLLPAFPFDGDPVASKNTHAKPLPEFSNTSLLTKINQVISLKSIEQLASNQALPKRYQKMFHANPPAIGELLAGHNSERASDFWNIRAYYMALACIACSVVIPPHKIVLGAEFDPLDDIDKRTEHFFKMIRRGWARNFQPVFNYAELQQAAFFSRPMRAASLVEGGVSTLAYTGAVGMCYAAAEATTHEKTFFRNRGLTNVCK